MQKYVLTFGPEVFIWKKGKVGMIYNSSNFKYFQFALDRRLGEICDQLNELSELYKVVLTERDLNAESLKSWIHNVLSIRAAVLEELTENYKVSLKPVLKVQYDRDKILTHQDSSYIADCLREINIHLTRSIQSDSEENYYKQFLYPQNSGTSKADFLNYRFLEKLLHYIPNKENVQINFVGEIMNYPCINKLINLLHGRVNCISFYHKYHDGSLNVDKLQILRNFDNKIYRKISDTGGLDWMRISEIDFRTLKSIYIVQSEDELNEISSRINEVEYELIPYYNGTNLDFFQNHVFIDADYFKNLRLSKRHVFINQALNANYFGKLELYVDGAIYSNPNFAKLGSVDDDFSDILFNAFSEESGWFLTRKQAPCNNCVFQWLCPSPSNYELSLNRLDLCQMESHNI